MSDWIWFLVPFVGIAFMFFLFWKLDSGSSKKPEEKPKEPELDKKIRDLLKTNFSQYTSIGITKKFANIKKEIQEERVEDHPKVQRFYKKVERLIRTEEKFEEEQEEKRKLEEERKKQEAIEENRREEIMIQELLDYKKKKKSIHALPIKHNYQENVVRQAKYRMEDYMGDMYERSEARRKAIDYYQNNELDTKPFLETDWEEKLYAEIRKKIKMGKLQIQKAPKDYAGQKLPKNFYRAKSLNPIEKQEALAQGFKHVRGNELSGKICGGGFYLLKGRKRESDKHFILKHLFAELHENMQMEYGEDDLRADVVLLIEELKFAIEIETGANKEEQIRKKVAWLNQHFTQWMFVCQQKNLARYTQYVDNHQSLCMTPKKAKEFVINIIESIAPLSEIDEEA